MITVRTEGWIREGFDLYKNHMGLLILAALLVVVVSVISLGLLGGPMAAGFFWVALRLKDGASPAPTATDVFKGFEVFVPTFLFGLVLGVSLYIVNQVLGFVPVLGWVAAMLATIAIAALVFFALPLIVDRRMEFVPAVKASVELVKPVLPQFMLFVFLAGLAGGVGALLCGVGLVLTLPISYCAMAVAYRDGFGGAGEVTTPPAPPPPPPA